MNDLEQVYISAVRYALGRRTYIVDVVSRHIMERAVELSQECKDVIVRDIKEAEDYGHACDHGSWMRLLDCLLSGGGDNK